MSARLDLGEVTTVAAAALLAQKDKVEIAASRSTSLVAWLHYVELVTRHGDWAAPPCCAYFREIAKPWTTIPNQDLR